MSRSKPPVTPLHALTPGQLADFFALLAARTKGATRDGKPYYSCKFRDSKRTAACMVWADGPWFEACERDWQEGKFYKLRALYGEHEKYGPQIEIHNIRLAGDGDRGEGFDPGLLVEASRFDCDLLFDQLVTLVETEVRDEPLRRLVLGLLRRHEQALKRLPATENKFHPFRGGWLEHVVAVAANCLHLTEFYLTHYPGLQPPLNRDLVLAGAVLHDLGRVVELSDDVAPQPTVPGRLVGHLILGRDLVRDAAREQGDLHPELIQLLEHIILSHLALPEWGSPRLPAIPEVLILHHADDLDAKMEMYARCLSRDTSPGPFTARDPILGKPLLKQRSI